MRTHQPGGPWDDYRRRRAAAWASFALLLLVTMVLLCLFRSPATAIVVFFIGGIVNGWLLWRVIRFLCPQCGELFFWPRVGHANNATKRCLNCGLEKWADPNS